MPQPYNDRMTASLESGTHFELPGLAPLSRPHPEAWREMAAALERLGPICEAIREPGPRMVLLTARDALALGDEPERGSEAPASRDPELEARRAEIRRRCSAAQAHNLERARHDPLAFARALLETALRPGWKSTGPALELPLAASHLLASPAFELLDLEAVPHLRALGSVYVAEVLLELGERRAARMRIEAALAGLHSSASPELRARILAGRARLETSDRELRAARRALLEAEGLVGACPMAGRRAEHLVEVARYYLEGRRPDLAFPVLGRAEDLLEKGLDDRLWLEVLHHRASAALSLGRREQAEELLERAGPFYGSPWVKPCFEARQDWLRGRLARAAGRTDPAISLLERATRGLLEHGSAEATLAVFHDLLATVATSAEAREHLPVLRSLYEQIDAKPGLTTAVAGLFTDFCRRMILREAPFGMLDRAPEDPADAAVARREELAPWGIESGA